MRLTNIWKSIKGRAQVLKLRHATIGEITPKLLEGQGQLTINFTDMGETNNANRR